MQIFKNRWFVRFARREKISDDILFKVIEDAERGIIDADLGGHVIKQRIARPGQGKSGGYRTIVIFKQGGRAFFVYGFAKNERGNIDKDELVAFKKAAEHLLELDAEQLANLLENGALTEVIP
ncbi:MAG: type II toxin-antitoxin system RelE/ParE family toxin [Gammaproteobacteria bacterium]|nr:type II toxin-antitoxin system RelE/ParE family toxin [Gammaproteobacteria bacterium]MBU1723554.1 type II toxin-antitoxin system RelE/ParE family toxin [Gammaproteobacteria bacterium]MBU2004112.1 type II toxin-antitoxin system RelE/ParE family toxin [Gammaproteobacteria bacterium]